MSMSDRPRDAFLGFGLAAWNRSRAKAESLVAHGATEGTLAIMLGGAEIERRNSSEADAA